MNSPNTVSLVGLTTSGSARSFPPACVTTASSGLNPSTCSASRWRWLSGMSNGKYTFSAPVALIRRSTSACMCSQSAYAYGRTTIVPRTGPLSASSACPRSSWYHWGKLSARDVSTAEESSPGPAAPGVAPQGLPVAEAGHVGVERRQAPRRRPGALRVRVEHADHRPSLVAGQRVARNEDTVAIEPGRDVARGVPSGLQDHGIVLPAEPVAAGHAPIRNDRRR